MLPAQCAGGRARHHPRKNQCINEAPVAWPSHTIPPTQTPNNPARCPHLYLTHPAPDPVTTYGEPLQGLQIATAVSALTAAPGALFCSAHAVRLAHSYWTFCDPGDFFSGKVHGVAKLSTDRVKFAAGVEIGFFLPLTCRRRVPRISWLHESCALSDRRNSSMFLCISPCSHISAVFGHCSPTPRWVDLFFDFPVCGQRLGSADAAHQHRLQLSTWQHRQARGSNNWHWYIWMRLRAWDHLREPCVQRIFCASLWRFDLRFARFYFESDRSTRTSLSAYVLVPYYPVPPPPQLSRAPLLMDVEVARFEAGSWQIDGFEWIEMNWRVCFDERQAGKMLGFPRRSFFFQKCVRGTSVRGAGVKTAVAFVSVQEQPGWRYAWHVHAATQALNPSCSASRMYPQT